MAVSQCFVPLLFFSFSTLLLNVFLSSFFLRPTHLTWTRTAAEEAEAVADISCSGHGRAYVDGVVLEDDGKPVCECNSCYSGPDCSRLLPNCSADADSGEPLFLEPYWMRHAAASAVVLSGWHRMGYEADAKAFMTRELVRHIRTLHRLVGNAKTDGKYIAIGGGSTQLLNAALYALAPENSPVPTSVVATVPYYPAYRTLSQLLRSKAVEWKGATADWLNSTEASSENFIELVTSPNNPDSRWLEASLPGASAIYDRAYYWPHYAAIRSPADDDITLFTISKLTGHPGSRFGWALVRNETVYKKILYYMEQNTYGISRETQLRVLKIIKVMISQIKKGGGEDGDIFRFAYGVMRRRWSELNAAVSAGDRFSLQKISPEHCTYFGITRDPSPAYGWLRCEREEEKGDCYAVLRGGGITAQRGGDFGADGSYVRLSLIRHEDDFRLLMQRMKELASAPKLAGAGDHDLRLHDGAAGFRYLRRPRKMNSRKMGTPDAYRI